MLWVQWVVDDRGVHGRAELDAGALGLRVERVREGAGLLSVGVDRGRCSWHAMLMGREAGGGFYVCPSFDSLCNLWRECVGGGVLLWGTG